ncbi:MAG: hypothetical protein IPH88_11030 [Bacteroidales bacterium]|nr:hypothetical protein [Bacteroidales bacterium]
MKTKGFQFIALLLLATGLFSCKDSFVERRTYTAYVPTYMTYDEMRLAIKATSPTEVGTPGKIAVRDQYLFINEKYKGVHIYDNSNPAAPVNLSFIDIPGNVDMAIKGNFLYADSYVDLVVINIRDVNNPIEIARIQNIFPYTIPETDYTYPITGIDQAKGVITGWQVQEVTEDAGAGGGYRYFYYDKASNMVSGSMDLTSSSTQIIGVGGSLARFIIYGDQFYGLNQTDMQVIDITNPTAPVAGSKIQLQRMVETVFIDQTNLFIGTQTGMLIYSLNNPATPTYITEYNHMQSCDPVVVQDNMAYVTMRAGNNCGNFQNLMDVIDLHVITSPQLVRSYPMTEPYGLGIDNKKLFVCDGSAGLKIYDATDPLRIDEHLLSTFSSIQARDVIPMNGVLVCMTTDGIYQYDYTDLNNLQLLSTITFGK